MADSALIVVVPEAEPFVKHLREKFDPSAALGVPAHITVLYPFVPTDLFTENVFERIEHLASRTAQIEFRVAEPARFSNILYLQPKPAQPFIELTLSVARAFPDYPPYRDQFENVVPHLSVAKGEESRLLAVERLLSASLPQGGAAATCDALVLIENSTGQWRERRTFALQGRY